MNPTYERRSRARALCAIGLIAAALLPLAAPGTARISRESNSLHATEWPRSWEGRDLRPLALSAVEERFAQQFPGRIGRFDAGDFSLVLREVNAPTRQLHPAVDCYRGLGYAIEKIRLERDSKRRMWRCFLAVREGQTVRVCERIESAAGDAFTDTSAWFWAAAFGRTRGPWTAVTQVQRL